MDVTADMILDLLRVRHANDVFVAECKDGPSQSGNYHRIDAWAMKRSWVHPLVIAYEIKVSRSDFLGDKKWMGYLPYCNEFYFACAHGIVSPAEVPAEAGLLVGSKNTRRLHCKKKAVYRDVTIPESLYRYILFARARITREQNTEKGAHWRDFLEDRRDLKDIGYRVSRKLRETVKHRVDEAEKTNKRLQKQIENLQDVSRLCERLGINPALYGVQYAVERQLEALQEILPQGLKRQTQILRDMLDEFLSKLTDTDQS